MRSAHGSKDGGWKGCTSVVTVGSKTAMGYVYPFDDARNCSTVLDGPDRKKGDADTKAN